MYLEPRPARPEELPAVVALANRVFGSDEFDMGSAFPLLFCEENAEQLRIIDADGEPVSHVGFTIRDAVLGGATIRTACIGAVCTDPNHRGQGHASRLMENALAHSRAREVDLMLISGGRGLYHRLGYVHVGRFPRYRVSRGPISAAVTVTEYAPTDLPAVMALHGREPVRFRRSAHDWQRLLAAGRLECALSTLWIVRLSGHPVAYVSVQQPGRDKEGNLKAAGALEYAGDRWAIAEALPEVIARMEAPALELMGPAGDLALAAQAGVRGWQAEIKAFGGTLAVIRPREFFQRLSPWIEERLGPDGSGLQVEASEQDVRFHFDGETYHLDSPGRVAALVFGGDTTEARDVPPLTGRVGELLQRLFPMPLVSYGYNFI